MSFGKLVVADVHALHVLLGQPREHVGHLVRTVARLKYKRQEHVRSIGCVVSVDKLGHRPREDDVMQPLKARMNIRIVSASDVWKYCRKGRNGISRRKLPNTTARSLRSTNVPFRLSLNRWLPYCPEAAKTAQVEYSRRVWVSALSSPPCSFPQPQELQLTCQAAQEFQL